MQNTSVQSRKSFPALALAQTAVEAILRTFAYYLTPLGIGLISLVALFFWDSQYVTRGGQPLTVKVVTEEHTPLTPVSAAALLAGQPASAYHDTHLSEAPVWFVFHILGQGKSNLIEFPSRHAIDIACWDGATLQPLGSATRARASPWLAPAKAGFALRAMPSSGQVLCRGTFAGPARLTAVQWPASEFSLSVEDYHRKSGLLDGGMVVLALFVLLTALINRRSLYVLFAGWMILSLRMGAVSAGWDIQWLGQIVPPHWLLLSRKLTIALYGMSTLMMFQALFHDHLVKTRFLLLPLRITQWACLPLLVGAFAMPYGAFLPMLWVILVFGYGLMTLGLIHLMIKAPTRVAMWFAASFAINYVSSLAEVVSAALGLHELLNVINSVTAALTSSLLASLAVAEQMRMETEKRMEAQEKLEHAYEAMPVGLFTLDMNGRFLSSNPALEKMLGLVEAGRTAWKQFFAETLWDELHEQVHAHLEAEMEMDNRDGSQRFLVSATLARGRIEGVLQDITEKTKATEQLRFMANNDPLTKVYNRRGIEKMFESAAQSLALGKPMALAYVDLDRFKLINDLFGHTAGDEVLKQVCDRAAMMLGGGQRIGRVGGDEFVIVMPDTTIAVARLLCASIVERIGGKPYRVGEKAFYVRGSIGLIEVSPGMSMQDAISNADHACREAKVGAQDGLQVYERNASAFREREAELNLMARLAGPNATEGMFLEMQPIMSLRSPQDSLNFEVLLRMREPDGRVMQAGPIIGAAEKSGHAGVIDRWVLATTLRWISDNHAKLPNTRFVCMNLSGASLNDERFVQDTFKILSDYAQVADRLCIEITESVALHDLDNTRRFIDQVRTFGAKVALDDFGAGYTSFSYLKELPADVLKIDGNFVVNINAHPANVAIVEAIVSLAVNLGMKTIAEWAEDAATVQTLAEIGVDYVQGYAVSRSQPPEALLAARSSASFIRDEELLELLRTLGERQTTEWAPLHGLD